jgi:hypothetical protein
LKSEPLPISSLWLQVLFLLPPLPWTGSFKKFRNRRDTAMPSVIPEFPGAANLHKQYCHTHNILHLEYPPAVPLSIIGRIFNVADTTMHWHYQHDMARSAMPHENGRPPLLSPKECNDLIGYIAEAHSTNHACTMHNFVRRIGEQHGKVTNANSVGHVLARDPRVKPYQGMALEGKRLEVAREDIEAYFHHLADAVEGVPAHVVYAMDEMGHPERADRQQNVCYLPSSHTQPQVSFPVSRTRVTHNQCCLYQSGWNFSEAFDCHPQKNVRRRSRLNGTY